MVVGPDVFPAGSASASFADKLVFHDDRGILDELRPYPQHRLCAVRADRCLKVLNGFSDIIDHVYFSLVRKVHQLPAFRQDRRSSGFGFSFQPWPVRLPSVQQLLRAVDDVSDARLRGMHRAAPFSGHDDRFHARLNVRIHVTGFGEGEGVVPRIGQGDDFFAFGCHHGPV